MRVTIKMYTVEESYSFEKEETKNHLQEEDEILTKNSQTVTQMVVDSIQPQWGSVLPIYIV